MKDRKRSVWNTSWRNLFCGHPSRDVTPYLLWASKTGQRRRQHNLNLCNLLRWPVLGIKCQTPCTTVSTSRCTMSTAGGSESHRRRGVMQRCERRGLHGGRPRNAPPCCPEPGDAAKVQGVSSAGPSAKQRFTEEMSQDGSRYLSPSAAQLRSMRTQALVLMRILVLLRRPAQGSREALGVVLMLVR